MSNFKKYASNELKHLQQIELMILKDIISICEKNNITYFLYGGSNLGAVRHEGFIPWDDDIDVIMFRKDYEKFLNISRKELSDKYDILSPNLNDNYYLHFSKISLKGTLFFENENILNQVSYTQGIFVDIFPLDNVPNNRIRRLIYSFRCRILIFLRYNSMIKFKSNSNIKKCIQYPLHYILKVFSLKDFLNKKFDKTLTKYNETETKFIIEHGAQCGISYYNYEDFKSVKKVKFEDIDVNIPIGSDRILTEIYGNYMKLPPENKRYNHSPDLIDFGKF